MAAMPVRRHVHGSEITKQRKKSSTVDRSDMPAPMKTDDANTQGDDIKAKDLPSRRGRAAAKRSTFRRGGNKRITKKTQEALHQIIVNGKNTTEAAAIAGMTVRGLKHALAKDHVKEWGRGILQANVNQWGVQSIALTAAMMSDTSIAAATRLEAQREIRRIAGVDLSDGKAEIGQSTRLIIEIKTGEGDGALIVDQGSNTVRAKEPQPLRLNVSESKPLGHDDDVTDVEPEPEPLPDAIEDD